MDLKLDFLPMGKIASLYSCPHAPATQVKKPTQCGGLYIVVAFILLYTGSPVAGSLSETFSGAVRQRCGCWLLGCGEVAGLHGANLVSE